MNDLFPGYYKKNDNQITQLWDKGIIMFDASVLLNLYRYSSSTKEILLKLIEKFSDKVYLPHQAALEYNRNRCEVISQQEKDYNEFLGKISQIKKDLQSTSKPPFLTSSVDGELNSVFKKVEKEVSESIKKYSSYLNNDPIYIEVSKIFQGRITNSFTEKELESIYKEGESRYKEKIPPGFEDEKSKDGNNKYGDLILWKQIILKAKELKKDIILIIDDNKIDWWWKLKDGRIQGPRQELVEEIKSEAKVDFHMYSSERFLSFGLSFLDEKINKNALDEIEAMKKAEREEARRDIQIRNEISQQELKIIENIANIKTKLEEIDSQISRNIKEQNIIEWKSMSEEEIKNFNRIMHLENSSLSLKKAQMLELLNEYQKMLEKITRRKIFDDLDRKF